MRNLSNSAVFKAALLASGAGAIAFATPAIAQDTGAEEEDRIVVTGSRIQRRDFDSNSPIVTIDEGLLEQSSTAAIEQNLNKLPQFVPAKTPTQGGDIQPTATNTPGSATVSLRGIGANRNLVLLDGRRGTPGNATGVVDITTIPSAAIERVEVISGGASATYGADAVAGVTNFILKKNFEGLELDAQMGITQEGDGFEYQLSGIMGTDFADGRGNVSIAMSINTREASFQRDSNIYQDLWANGDAGGAVFFLATPGVQFSRGNAIDETVLNGIFDQRTVDIPTENVNVYVNPDGTVFTGDGFTTRGGLYRFDIGQQPEQDRFRFDSTGALDPIFSDAYLILPLTRYNGFARGNFEINDWIGVFGQAMFSHVETSTIQAPGPITGGWGVSVPFGNQTYLGDADRGIVSSLNSDGTTNAAYLAGGQYGLNCPATGGCATSQVFPVPFELEQLLLARDDPDANFNMRASMPEPRETFTDVTTYTMIAGLEGSVPGTDFTWEAFVSHGVSTTFARQTGIYSLFRTREVLTSPNFGYGFNQQGNTANGGFGASTGTCTSGLNFYSPPQGGYSEDCLEAIRADLKNRSEVRQTIAEVNIQGGIVDLPAGTVRFALGASFREMDYEFLNDTLTTQGRSFQDQALGIYPSGNSFGFIDTHEIYGELLIPVLADIPGIQEFNLELGGRMSDYSTTGTSYTYKILGDWQVTDWLRFRGGFNRAERAPNIAELFLAPQQTFGVNNRGDVCSLSNPNSFSANPDTNPNAANVEATCRALMELSGEPNADEDYYSEPQSTSSFGFAFPTLIGNPNLSPETADTWTAGVVLQPFIGGSVSRARLTVDWFQIKVDDAIGAQTVGSALQQCFDPVLNPLVLTDPNAAAQTQFCQNVPRNQTGTLGNVFITYVNNGRFTVSGIDAALDLGFDVGPGTLNLNVLANYQLEFKSADLPTNPLVEYVGTFGTTENGLNQGAYDYRILTTVGYSWGPAMLSLQWRHLPSVADSSTALIPTSQTTGAPAYNLFSLNGSYAMNDSVNLRFGVENLFDKNPPLTGRNLANDDPTGNGLTEGGSYNSLFYDTQGRRFYLGANIQF